VASWQGGQRGAEAIASHKFLAVRKLSAYVFVVRKFLSKNAKLVAENPPYGGNLETKLKC